MKEKIFTNCFLVKNNEEGIPERVCLAMKKRGFGQGMWNGSGGKPKEGETVEEAATREVQEEFDVQVRELSKRGEIAFVLVKEGKIVNMHTFLVTEWEGEPSETDEMKPQWFSINKVPYMKMWDSDREWLPVILTGKKIKAKYTYSHEGGPVQTRKLIEVESFD